MTTGCSRPPSRGRLRPMGNTTRRPDEGPAFDPRSTPVPRRSMLILMGAGAVVASGGLGAVLAACSGPPQTVTLDFDPATLVPGTPQEVPFTVVASNGERIPGSTWLPAHRRGRPRRVRPALHPRPVPLQLDGPAKPKFECQCHEGEFALDGTVLAGGAAAAAAGRVSRCPRLPAGHRGGVPSDFETPKESLPATVARAGRRLRRPGPPAFTRRSHERLEPPAGSAGRRRSAGSPPRRA